MPVEREGVGEWGSEKVRGEVGELGRCRLCLVRWVRWKESFMQMAGGVGHLLEFVKRGVVGVEFRDVGMDIMVDLLR